MTDNEIIKALGICAKGIMFSKHDCKKCPYYAQLCCERKLKENALDLINRQQAEIERLVNIPPKDPMDFCGVVCKYAEELIEKAKTEAIKEFAERLKKGLQALLDRDMKTYYVGAEIEQIDNLVKEMVGDSEVQWSKQGKCPITPEQFNAIYEDEDGDNE